MMRLSPILTMSLAIAGTPVASAADEASAADDARAAAARGLEYLAQQGDAWIERQGCVSCHQIPVLLLSYDEAWRRGVSEDRTRLDNWLGWTTERLLSTNDDGEVVGSRNVEAIAMYFALEARPAGERARERESELLEIVLSTQEDDGSWKPGGQLPDQRRDADETREVSTRWSRLALTGISDRSETARKAKLGSDHWLAQRRSESDESDDSDETNRNDDVESIALAIAETRAAARSDVPTSLIERLVGLQNSDGGWSWATGEPSDPYATGQALWALSRSGAPTREHIVDNAVAYLVRTQKPDGSWAFPSTLTRKKKAAGKVSNYWGTGWATTGLLSTLPLRRARL